LAGGGSTGASAGRQERLDDRQHEKRLGHHLLTTPAPVDAGLPWPEMGRLKPMTDPHTERARRGVDAGHLPPFTTWPVWTG
jgi:hypothetical protein